MLLTNSELTSHWKLPLGNVNQRTSLWFFYPAQLSRRRDHKIIFRAIRSPFQVRPAGDPKYAISDFTLNHLQKQKEFGGVSLNLRFKMTFVLYLVQLPYFVDENLRPKERCQVNQACTTEWQSWDYAHSGTCQTPWLLLHGSSCRCGNAVSFQEHTYEGGGIWDVHEGGNRGEGMSKKGGSVSGKMQSQAGWNRMFQKKINLIWKILIIQLWGILDFMLQLSGNLKVLWDKNAVISVW